MINVTIAAQALPFLLKGAAISLGIWIIAIIIGFIGGTVLGVAHARGSKLLKGLVSGYVWFMQGTPMLVQISFLYYVLPQFGISFSSFWTAAIAIGLNSSAYVSQIVRSGINAVAPGTLEAAHVLGFSKAQTVWYILLPHALRIVIPALGNEGTTLIKDTSLASIIGVMELYKVATGFVNQTYDVVTLFVMLAVLYLFLTSTFSLGMSLLQKRMNHNVGH